MNHTPSTHRRLLTTATLLGLSLTVAACTNTVNEPAATTPAPVVPTASSPTASPTPSETTHANASDDPAKVELALEAAKIMTTWDPTKDFNRTEAEKRARKLMTDERAKQVIAPQRPATGEEWLNAAAKKATSKPSVKIMTEHHEKDSIAVKTTWQWVTDGGESWAGEESTTFFFTFTDKAPYKIRDYTAE